MVISLKQHDRRRCQRKKDLRGPEKRTSLAVEIVPAQMIETIRKLNHEFHELLHKHGKEPLLEEMTALLDPSLRKDDSIHWIVRPFGPMDTQANAVDQSQSKTNSEIREIPSPVELFVRKTLQRMMEHSSTT